MIELAPKSLEIRANWSDARLYCFSLGEGWRLPTRKELDSFNAAVHELEVVHEYDLYYWSSEANSSISVWVQKFKGFRHQFATHVESLNWVRPVRDVKRKRAKR